jgi:hypothetical protein
VDVRIDCVTVPGGWERIAVCVCFSECARRCETRVDCERSSSEVRSGRFVGTMRFFGRAASRHSLEALIFRNEGVHTTVHRKRLNGKQASSCASINVKKGKAAETQNAVGEWNS